MPLRRWLRSRLRAWGMESGTAHVHWILVVLLLVTASLKWGREPASDLQVLRAVAAVEFVLAAGLVMSRTRRASLIACAAGFTGAAIATLVLVAQGRGSAPCGCLGQIDVSRGEALLLQGGIIVLAVAGVARLGCAESPSANRV